MSDFLYIFLSIFSSFIVICNWGPQVYKCFTLHPLLLLLSLLLLLLLLSLVLLYNKIEGNLTSSRYIRLHKILLWSDRDHSEFSTNLAMNTNNWLAVLQCTLSYLSRYFLKALIPMFPWRHRSSCKQWAIIHVFVSWSRQCLTRR